MSSSIVDICNLALANLGDVANVSDLEEMSAQSDHCKRFYPICLNLLLEQHAWSFATRRVLPALVADPPVTTWKYCYAVPSDAIKVIAIIPEGGNDRDSASFAMESDSDGNRIIFADVPNATLRYVALEDNTTRFTPMFTITLGWLLASYLAGPIVKGEAGVRAGSACNQIYIANLAQAKASDANQQQVPDTYIPQSIRARAGAAGLPPFGREVR